MIDFSNNNIDKTLQYISISQVLEQLSEPFDQVKKSQDMVDKYFNDPKSKYYQMTAEAIQAMWTKSGDDSKHYGRLLDNYIGLLVESNFEDSRQIQKFILDNDADNDERLKGLMTNFDLFRNNTNIFDKFEFVTREKTVYYRLINPLFDENDLFPLNKYIYVKGRFDALLQHKKSGKWLIIDWKSSGEIDKSPKPWTKKMFGPAKDFWALNWYSYTLQCHFYKKALLESEYLPEGTKPEDVAIKIVQIPWNNKYNVESEAFQYDSELMDKIFKFAWKKKNLSI